MSSKDDAGPKTEFSKQLHQAKYRLPGETFDGFCERVSWALTRTDPGAKTYESAIAKQERDKLYELLATQSWLPAGRQQLALGNPAKLTLFNCFVSGRIKDSFDGIMNGAVEAGKTMRLGGGVGTDFSTIRPRGTEIKTLKSEASGPVSFMHVFDALGKCVMSAGARRGAQMAILRVDHPDVEEFVTAKHTPGSLTQFNVSVAITDEFMQAVKSGSGFDLRWNGSIYKTVDARKLWDLIMMSTWDHAEPGVVFIDSINKYNPLSYCEDIIATNPCVSGDTEILTKQGYKRIDSLVGQTIPVWNGSEWSDVTPQVTGKYQHMMRVVLSNGEEIDCTPYHNFILEGGARVKAMDLKQDDIVNPFDLPVIKSGEDYEHAYTQGFFSGDGHFKRGKPAILLYGPKKDLVDQFPHENVTEYEMSNGESRIGIQLTCKTLDKKFVPTPDWSVSSRLEWLAGLIDSDGCCSYNKREDGTVSSVCLQIASIDKSFLINARRMLTTLGVNAKVQLMREGGANTLPDGRGGNREYETQDCYRLLISATDVLTLRNLGLNTRRVKSFAGVPQRDASRKIRVISISPLPVADKVYCFNEPKNHSGCFNGVVLGNCSEIPLPAYGSCLLGSVNLVKYIKKNCVSMTVDYSKLESDVRMIIKATDRMIDIANMPLPQQEIEAKSKRRMGVGVTGLSNTIEICGHKYGSPGYIAMQDKILQTVRDAAYQSSICIAMEKGSFPLFDSKKWLDSGFAKTLPDNIRDDIKKHGLRNGLLLSIAPTGTISLTADNISSGIEPPYLLEANRVVKLPGGDQKVTLKDWALENYGVRSATAEEISVDDHVNVLCAAQKYIDNSISKTVNVGDHVTFDQFKDVYMKAYENGAKGCATFRKAGKRAGIITAVEQPKESDQSMACTIDPQTGDRTCA